MKLVFSLLILFLSQSLAAQNIKWNIYEKDSLSNQLEFTSELDMGGKDILNHIFYKSAFGGAIDRELINDISKNISTESSVGLFSDSRIRYIAAPSRVKLKNNNSLFLEFGNVITADTRLTRDLFHLAFLGNADRLGETLQLGKSSFSSMIYQYAGLGVMREKTRCYLSVNLVNIQSYLGVELNNTTLYTGEQAETLELNYQGETVISDSLSGNLGSNSGLGFSLNGRWNIPLNNEDVLSMEIRNAGLAILNRPTRTIFADSSFTFSGLSINQLITNADYLTGISYSDSIKFNESSQREVVNLPSSISAKYLNKINKSDYFQLSASKYFIRSHALELGIDYLHKETRFISYAIGLSYGGFNHGGRIRLGAHFGNENWNISLQTTHLAGLFMEKAKGINLSFGIQRKLYTAS